MEVAYRDLEEHRTHIEGLKKHMINRIKKELPFVSFNGICRDFDNSLYTILSVSLSKNEYGDLLLFNLDLLGVACSGGSACSSGSVKQSHVISEIKTTEGPIVRFSFGKFNTLNDVDYAVNQLKSLFD